nr:hypothetical protein [Chloroflexota bacterium]
MAGARTKCVGEDKGFKVVAWLLALTALLTVVFWVVFFADYAAQDESYFAQQCGAWLLWERSFPAADLWMASACLVGAVGLWKRRPWGLLFALLSGSALIFLGLMDALFFLQNGLYWPVNADVMIEAVIHLWALTFGPFVIAYTWRRRQQLLAE